MSKSHPLSKLLVEAGIEGRATADVTVSSLTADSRKATAGSLFVAYPSQSIDSLRYLKDAQQNGAVAAIVGTPEAHREATQLGLATILVAGEDFHATAARVAHAFFEYPTRELRVLGVTGTNGKTTVAWIIREMVESLGRKTAYIGTLGFGFGETLRPLANTTPFGVDLVAMLAEARDAGCQLIAMEVSSHALAEGRVAGIEFDVAVFTNLTQDHLDFHGSMEAYAAAKKRLFFDLPRESQKPFVAVLNLDDPTGRAWERSLKRTRTLGFRQGGPRGAAGGEGIRAEVKAVELERIVLQLEDGTWQEEVEIPLGGTFNVENALAAFAGVLALHWDRWLGEDFDASEAAFLDSAQALEAVHPVPGRFETIANTKGITAIVDYAHTPDALEKLLNGVRSLTKGRVITVFGCGGDRDRTKRPLMAQAAGNRSDLTILTSDNPRTEDPQAILAEVAKGLPEGKPHLVIEDRREAILRAVAEAAPGDTVVVAGKGHEDYQIVGTERRHFDDREVLREALA